MKPKYPEEPRDSAPAVHRNGQDTPESPSLSDDFLPPWDQIPDRTLYERMAADGVELPLAVELEDAAVARKLQEIIAWLAEHNTYLECTDHLSDRELYVVLVEETFHELMKDLESVLPREEAAKWIHHLDILGSGSDEDTVLYFRFYANDRERRDWQELDPDYEMPPREKPPYDRDRHLPQPKLPARR